MERPWFKLFAADYLLDAKIDKMPKEAIDLLIRMWCVCHLHGSCPADPEELARATHCSLSYVLQCKPHCEPLFQLQSGLLFSARMQEEKKRSDQARDNANKRYNKRTSGIGTANCNANSTAVGSAQSQSHCQSQDQTKVKSKSTHFVRPTLEEVRAFCLERGNDVDAEKFMHHYNANGWKVGRVPMRNWKSAIMNTWEAGKRRPQDVAAEPMSPRTAEDEKWYRETYLPLQAQVAAKRQ